MPRQSQPYSTATSSRYVITHSTSSTYSSSTNSDEDWTTISDPVERRRIQNRVAQRNYRKRLKRRLEDLERRAGLSSASLPKTPVEAQQSNRKVESLQQYTSPDARLPSPPSAGMPSIHFAQQMQTEDYGTLANNFRLDGCRKTSGFHMYPAPEDTIYPSHTQPNYPISISGERTRADADCLAPVPITLR